MLRSPLLCFVALLGCRDTGPLPTTNTATSSTSDTGTPTKITETGTSGDPCDPDQNVVVAGVVASQPWSAHEALIDVRVSDNATVAVTCQLDSDPDEVHLAETSRSGTSHQLRMAGLLADSSYSCRAAAVCPSSTSGTRDFTLSTRSSDDGELPGFDLTTTTSGAGADYLAVNHQRAVGWNGQRMIVLDRDAQIRWHGLAPGGSAMVYEPGLGGFTIAGSYPASANNRMRVVRLFGGDVSYDISEDLDDYDTTLFHHDGRRLPDGRYLTLEERGFQTNLGVGVVGFGARIVDPQTGTVDFDYDSVKAYEDGHLTAGVGNTYHANWVNVYDDVMHFSLCGRSLTVAVDVPSGAWRWAFGAGGDFALVDTKGKALPDDDFPQCQHGLTRVGDRLLVYDNGIEREESRVVEYQLDEKTMTATLLWKWTEPGWYEKNLGSVDWTEGGNVLVGIGHREPISPSPGAFSRMVELDPKTGTKLWEARFHETNDQMYRADSIGACTLFANAKYCPDMAARIEALAPVF